MPDMRDSRLTPDFGDQMIANAATNPNFERIACSTLRSILAIFTHPLEMLLRKNYGTRYINVPQQFLSTLVFPLMCIGCWLLSMGSAAPFFVLAAYWVLFYFNAFRHVHLMTHIEKELHSQLDGTSRFKLRGPWFLVRVIYEPLIVIAGTVLLYLLKAFGIPMAIYFVALAFLLASKQLISWYEEWMFVRDAADKRAMMPVMSSIMTGDSEEQPVPIFEIQAA